MTVSVLEGEVTIEAFDVTVTIPAGSRATVPMDDQMRASGPPTDAEPYDPSRLAALPISLLERPITIDAEATPEATNEAEGSSPEAGQWVWTNGEVSEEGCMAGVSTMILTQMTPRAPFNLTGGEFSMEALLSSAYQGRSLAGAVYGEADGLYSVDFPSPNGNGHFEVRAISPTRMDGLMVMCGEGCVINIPFEVRREGE